MPILLSRMDHFPSHRCFGSRNYPPGNPACNPSTAKRSRYCPGDLDLLVRSNFWDELGTTIPSAVFNNRFNVLVKRIIDPIVVSMLADGSAYEHATEVFLDIDPESGGMESGH
jgi:hypothetical protein